MAIAPGPLVSSSGHSLKHGFLFLTMCSFLFCFQASVATPIYTVAGQPMEELPCPLEIEGTAPNPDVESMWAQYNGSNYLMVIAGDINGTYERFRQLILGGDTIHHNATYINPQFYGRVNMSAAEV